MREYQLAPYVLNGFALLACEIVKGGFTHRQVKQGTYAYIYEQSDTRGKVKGYEVFKRKTRKARVVGNKFLESSERFPESEAFGKWAWSKWSPEGALKYSKSGRTIRGKRLREE
jgi:hypothetical protein